MSRAAILTVGAALLAVLVAVSLSRSPASAPAQAKVLKAGAFDPALPAPAFALPGSAGSEVTLASYRGKVVLLTFGFTYCATVCPTTLSTLAQAKRTLGAAGDAVQVIFVTVDPERDDAVHMRDYLAAFDPSFLGATGTPEALAAMRKAYGVTAEKHGTGSDYVMGHTSSIFLIDKGGKLRGLMPFGREPADFAHDITLLLAEPVA